MSVFAFQGKPRSGDDLAAALRRVALRRQRFELWRRLAGCWALAAGVALCLYLLQRQFGLASALSMPLLALAGAVVAAMIAGRRLRAEPDLRELARRIERQHPELDGRLLTALQQRPDGNGNLGFLQQRLLQEVLRHSRQADWTQATPAARLALVEISHWLALALFGLLLWNLRTPGTMRLLVTHYDRGVTVTPGDTELERGTALVVVAHFGGSPPPSVELVMGDSSSAPRVPLVKSLADPMFGGSVPEVTSNFVYHLEYGGHRTRDFSVKVFEYPRLERADADLAFPTYTAQPVQHIANTRRVSAVEGTRLDLALALNKPVVSARLVSRSRRVLELGLGAGQPMAFLKQYLLESNLTWELQLKDSEGRTNKVSAQFVLEALKNRPPEIRLARPRGDARPSPLEEIPFEGTVWDDFGVQAYGLAYVVAGQEPQTIELGRDVPAKEKRAFKHLLRLEDLGVQPDQLVSWFAWADDVGPDGKTRHTTGDLFFGEIRPFEEVFREGQGMDGESEGSGESSGQNRTTRLTELEKQIISATWKLQRDQGALPGTAAEKRKSPAPAPEFKDRRSRSDEPRIQHRAGSVAGGPRALPSVGINPAVGLMRAQVLGQADPGAVSRADAASSPSPSAARARRRTANGSSTPTYQEDATVVLDSQAEALTQAKATLERQRDPRAAALWRAAIQNMEQALGRLQQATNSPAQLPEALTAEQAAYQALLRLQEHEYQVTRSRSRSQGGGRSQQMQRQLDQLDLEQSADRYETQRQAQRSPNTERREQLQVMNRLQELARRQQDLNERLKELQTALQEARTQEEKAEIQHRLNRLQEEEQQMLNDVDELRQRMDRPENQSQMAEERRQLDQTRQDVQRAAEAAGQGAASQALASGTRAQRQLQDMRDQMRKENSSQFADDVRDLRAQARELARQQENILKQIQQDDATERQSLSGSATRAETLNQLTRQKQRMTNLVARATQVSQQAETSEPLLSSQLYDSVRKFSQDGGKAAQEVQDDLLRRGRMTRNLFDQLQEGTDSGTAKLEDVVSEMLRLGFDPLATEAGERARRTLEDLKNGVEHAAESVLGDDTESLRLAREELDRLTSQLQREMAQAQAGASPTNQTGIAAGSTNQAGTASGQPGQGAGTNAPTLADREPGAAQRGQTGQATSQPGQDPGTNAASLAGREPASGQPETGSRGPSEQAASGGEPGNAGTASEPGNASQPGQGGGDQPGGGQRGLRRLAPSNPGRQPAGGGRQAGGELGGNWGDPAGGGNVGGGGGNWNWDRLLPSDAWRQYGPLTGEDFVSWSDRLREVEEMLDMPDLRNDVAAARERARLIRQEFKRDRKKPDWAVVQLRVMKPLAEVRERIAEELARRDSRQALVPIDRDPVPNQYSDLVRRYYEQLGKDK